MRKYTFIFVHLRVLIQHKRALDMKRSIKSFYDEENVLYTIFIHLDKPNINFIIPRNPHDMCTET